MALLIIGAAGLFSLKSAVKLTPRPPKLIKAMVFNRRVPKLMGMLVLGMQAGQFAHQQDPLSVTTLFAAAFGIAIVIAIAIRSGAEHKYK